MSCRAPSDRPPAADPAPKRRRSAPQGNQNRRTHGACAPAPPLHPVAKSPVVAGKRGPGGEVSSSRPITDTDDLIDDALARHTRLSDYIEARAAEMDTDELTRLFALYGQNASHLGRLLRDRRALSGDAADGLLRAVGTALDEISTELGMRL